MSSDKKSLTVLEQKQVVFYDDEVTAVLVDGSDGRAVYVPVKPICEFLGIAWPAQRRRINDDPVLSRAGMSMIITITDIIEPGSRRPHRSEMFCLPLKFIPGWLFGINVKRVKSELRDKIIRYQSECYEVLAEAFQSGRLTNDPAFSELLNQDSPSVQAYKMALAVVEIARAQIIIESRLDSHDQRLESLEAQLGRSDRLITPDEAMQISQAVKAIGLVLSKKHRRNEYGAIYGELYREFGVTSYKMLPAAKFDDCMAWLTKWHAELTGETMF